VLKFGKGFGAEPLEQGHAPEGGQEAAGAAQNREQEALGEHLPHEP
jgi:hypothetical protein